MAVWPSARRLTKYRRKLDKDAGLGMGGQTGELNYILVCAAIITSSLQVLIEFSYLRIRRQSWTLMLGTIVLLGLLFTVASVTIGIAWAAFGALLGTIILTWIKSWLSPSEGPLWLWRIAFLGSATYLAQYIWSASMDASPIYEFAAVSLGLLVSTSVSFATLIAGFVRLDRMAREADQVARDRKESQKQAARRKAEGLDNAGIARDSGQLLDSLYYKVVRAPDQSVALCDFVEEGGEIGDIWLLARHLEGLGDVELSNVHPFDWTERIRLTAQGFNRAAKTNDPASRTEVSIGRLINMGDFIQAGSNSIVINRSLLSNSLNKVREEVGSEVADAISAVADEVQGSNNSDAAELFDEFNRELQSDTPRKLLLKTLFEGVTKAAPTISSLTDATTKIAGLFS